MIEKVNFSPLEPKGLIKVELFEGNKKVDEVNTHNFIAKAVLTDMFKMAMKSLFTQNRKAGGRKFHDDINDIFRCMHLTDAVHPEDPENEWFLQGNEIGYALSDATYVGSDVLRGSYNEVESFTTGKKVRMVFDFPTHAANGTFQSIYFSNRGSAFTTNLSSNVLLFDKIPIPNGADFGTVTIKKHADKIYRLRNNYKTLDIFDQQYNLLSSITLPYTDNHAFEIVDNYIYFATWTSSRAVYKMPIADFSSHEVVATGYANAGGICYDPGEEQFIVASSANANNSSAVTIRRYDRAFNLLTTIDILNFSSNRLNLRLYTIDNHTILNNRILLSDGEVFENELMPFGYMVGFLDGQLAMQSGHTYPLYLIPKAQIGSRCLLDEPITKQPTQAMKITYDFILE